MIKVNKTSIKKELSPEEIERLLAYFQEELHNNTDTESLTYTLRNYVQKLTPANYVHTLYIKDDHTLETIIDEVPTSIDIGASKGLLKRCLQTQEPQLTNDTNRDPYYDEPVDNVFAYPLKNLLVIPLYDIHNNPFGLLWMGIPKGDINQFITQDVEHLQQLISLISYVAPKEESEPKQKQQEEETIPVAVPQDTESASKPTEDNTGHSTETPIEPSEEKTKAPSFLGKIRSIFAKPKES